MVKVKRRAHTSGGITDNQIVDWLRQFCAIDNQVKTFAKRSQELRDKLMGALESVGWTDNSGHLHLELSEPFEDPAGNGKKVSGAEAIRNIRQNFNAERTEELLRKKGLYKPASEGGCIRLVAEIDEDALAAARFRGLISDEEYEGCIDRKSWYAFKPVRS